ncbi:hypothetical protein [Halopseudomonas sabulinigri]|uniref:Sigma-70 family RNA polymerase sigma factor n=1 Tax=Halopseudomonas sabulinigri TaxID=472181 RepID=A0ABP9ZS53_9GAMM
MQHAGSDYLSQEEVRAKLSSLSQPDLLRLRQVASFQAWKLRGGDAGELLAEGLQRVVSGDRRWPRGLDTAPFMKNVFASIVSSHAKHAAFVGQYEVDPPVALSEGDALPDATSLENQTDPIENIYAQEMLGRLTAELSDDPEALAVAMSFGEGLTALETQSQFRLSPNQYDAARKRFRRVVNKINTEKMA